MAIYKKNLKDKQANSKIFCTFQLYVYFV